MILRHINYCFTNWSFTCVTTLKPIEQLYKRALKVYDKKPHSHHHCSILKRHGFFSFDNFKIFKQACAIYKVLHGLCAPPLAEFIKNKPSRGIGTRAATRGACEVQFRRSSFAQNVLSECQTFMVFKVKLKKWILDNQTCEH